jgi:hypothetical protein
VSDDPAGSSGGQKDGFPGGSDSLGAGSRWTGEARALLERAIERHGGWAAWERAGGVMLTPTSLTGLVPRWKGVGRTFPLPPRIEVWARRGVVIFHDYPVVGRRGVFAQGQVQLLEGATILEAHAQPRASFAGLRKNRTWSPLDALYFFGYSLAHYHSLPFSLVLGRPLRVARALSAGRPLSGVEVELPASLHTHCRRQTFFFDDDGLLRRHDYVAEIVGSWARGAHRWEDFVDVAGMPVARRRHVMARLGRIELPAVALHAEFKDAVLVTAPGGPRLKLV